MTDKLDQFLADLGSLAHKYGLAVEGGQIAFLRDPVGTYEIALDGRLTFHPIGIPREKID